MFVANEIAMFVSLLQHQAPPHRDVTISDVATAFLNATHTAEAQYAVEMPPELAAAKSRVWRLKKALCGLRGPPRSWQEHFVEVASQRCFGEGRTVWSRAGRRFDRARDIPVARLFLSKLQENIVLKLDAPGDSATFVSKKFVKTDKRYEVSGSSDYIMNMNMNMAEASD